MSLSAGTRLGPYEIVSALGVGGMGEVYRARDPKLNRDVAIKILPEAFAHDADRLARFTREAKTLAALNHPHIAGIYGLEESGGVSALVMELVEGEDLAQRLARGAIPLDEALPIAKQLADALEAAHDQGIVHRDLKPANIKVRQDGTVKVLDFGLAKALDATASSSPQMTNSPTLSLQATKAGIILGTAAYMSPEQAHGRAADRRADIFSFGAVLFEILSGTQAFRGESISDSLAAVLKVDPDWHRLPEDTPGAIRTLLRRCLTKDRAQRLQAIGEARIVLAQPALEQPETTSGTKPRASLARSTYPWVLSTAVALIVAAVATWGWLGPRPRAQPQVLRFSSAVSVANVMGGVALSNDGMRLAFVGGPRRQIFVRSMDQLEAAPIPNTEDAAFLCFAPDGRSISYIGGDERATEVQLMKVAVAGGPAEKLADVRVQAAPPTPHWMPDGNILFVGDRALLKVSSNGGQPETLATPDTGSNERFYQSPQVLPSGKDVLVSIYIGPGMMGNRVVAFNLETRQKKVLLENFGTAQFVPMEPGSAYGHLVSYDVSSGSLLAAPFDAKRLEVMAAPVPVLEGIRSITSTYGAFSVSDSGTLAYVPGESVFSPSRQIVWVDGHGVEQLTPAPTHEYDLPRLSPDGERVAVEIRSLNSNGSDIWVYDLSRGMLSRITTKGFNVSPVWTPDGKRLIYATGANPGETILMSAPVDRSSAPSAITSEAGVLLPASVSPDGETVIGARSTPANVANEISVVPLSLRAPTAKPRTFLTSPFRKTHVAFSPNGAWVAYASNDSGRLEVYVAAYPGPAGTFQISNDGGTFPRWSRDGRRLFYRNRAKMMAVDVQLSPTFRAGRAELLFEGNYWGTYDVAADGKRFVMIKNVGPAPVSHPDQLNIVVNWAQELKARVPAK